MELTEAFIAGLSVNEVGIMDRIASELKVRTSQVSAVISLIGEGCTIPFISRYRKERTGSLDEVQVRDSAHKFETYKNLEERRLEVIRGVFELGKLSAELYSDLSKAATLAEIEDIWLPFKKKKKTRGMLAEEKGLAPLAEIMAAGLPVVASEARGLGELVRGAGLLFPVGDAGGCARAIERIVAEPALAKRLVESGRARAAEYSIERCAGAYAALYGELLKEGA